MKVLLDLYMMFFKIGLFTFGGGYAMLPLFQSEIVKKRNYATDEEILDLYSIGQCTPGIIAVNISTFIGFKVAGIKGGIISTLGMVTPSVIIITSIAIFLKNFMGNEYVEHAFAGIRVCVVALILNILYGLSKKAISNKTGFFMFIFAIVLLIGLKLSAIYIVLLAGIFSFTVKFIQNRGKSK